MTTALYRDIWAGDVLASVRPFRTKRNGLAVTHYRWQRADGLHISAPIFTSPEAAAHWAQHRDQRFSGVES